VEGADLLAPADRREPRRPARQDLRPVLDRLARHVADGAQPERCPDGREGEAVRTSRGGRELRAQGRNRREGGADPRDPRSRDQGASRGQADQDQPGGVEEPEDDVGSDHRDERRNRLRVSPDGARSDELCPPGLLVLPRVTDDGEGAHQGGADRDEEERLRHHDRTLARPRHEPVEGERDAAPRGAARQVGALRRVGIELERAERARHMGEGQPEQPERELDPVAAQRQPREPADARERAHAESPA